MLNNDKPNEYVLASGKTHSVKYFITFAFKCIGIEGYWEGKGVNEKFFSLIKNKKTLLVEINERFYRPCEVELLVGDYSKANKELNWIPKSNLNDLIKKMVNHDINLLNNK